MDKRTRNIAALGLLTLIAAVLFFWGLYFLLGNPVLTKGLEVTLLLPDGAGMKRGDRVQLRGVEIGSVQSVALDPASGVVAGLRLNQDVPLPSDTRARVMGDVFGAHTIELVPGDSRSPLQDADTIHGMAVPELTEMAGHLTARAEAVLSAADSLLSPEAVASVHATAAALPASATELNAALVELRRASLALRQTAESVREARPGEALNGTLAEVDRSAVALAEAASTMEQTLASLGAVFDKIDRGKGTLGRLINDSSLYMQLHETIREVGLLAADIRERPGRYINLRVF